MDYYLTGSTTLLKLKEKMIVDDQPDEQIYPSEWGLYGREEISTNFTLRMTHSQMKTLSESMTVLQYTRGMKKYVQVGNFSENSEPFYHEKFFEMFSQRCQ